MSMDDISNLRTKMTTALTDDEKYLAVKETLRADSEMTLVEACRKHNMEKARYGNRRAADADPVIRPPGRFRAGTVLRKHI
jgi:hypothetical protein